MRIAKTFVALTAITLMLAACANQKEPAEKAVAQVESSLAEFRADAEKYAAEELKGVDESVTQAQEQSRQQGLQRRRHGRARGGVLRDLAQGNGREEEDRRGSRHGRGAGRMDRAQRQRAADGRSHSEPRRHAEQVPQAAEERRQGRRSKP